MFKYSPNTYLKQIALATSSNKGVNNSLQLNKVTYSPLFFSSQSTPLLLIFIRNIPVKFQLEYNYYNNGLFKNPKDLVNGIW